MFVRESQDCEWLDRDLDGLSVAVRNHLDDLSAESLNDLSVVVRVCLHELDLPEIGQHCDQSLELKDEVLALAEIVTKRLKDLCKFLLFVFTEKSGVSCDFLKEPGSS